MIHYFKDSIHNKYKLTLICSFFGIIEKELSNQYEKFVYLCITHTAHTCSKRSPVYDRIHIYIFPESTQIPA